MEHDVLKTKYKVEIVVSTGEVMDFTQYVTACTWSDPANEVAARASITFAQDKTDKGYINLILKLGTLVFIYANGQEVLVNTRNSTSNLAAGDQVRLGLSLHRRAREINEYYRL